jgi:hypothetical protein
MVIKKSRRIPPKKFVATLRAQAFAWEKKKKKK